MADSVAPIIIKRIKKAGHGGHHGGAWKVAYADFVTAMMAFFLLLWLLNVTTPEQKKGIADYFTPTIGIKDAKGIGVNGGLNSAPKGTSKNNLMTPGLVVGQVQQGPVAKEPVDAKEPDVTSESIATGKKEKPGGQDAPVNQDNQDSEQFQIAEKEIRQAVQQDADIQQFKNNVQVQDTPEGMKIDMIDDPKLPMFVAGGASLTDAGKKVLDSMANIISKTPNQIIIIGHTDAAGPSSNPHYTSWELSADRANAARRALSTTQLEPERVTKVIGVADRELLVPTDPSDPRNRRITIVLVRGSYFRDPKAQNNNSRAIISVPDVKLKGSEPLPVPAAPEANPAGPSIFDQSAPGTGKPAAAAPESEPEPAVAK